MGAWVRGVWCGSALPACLSLSVCGVCSSSSSSETVDFKHLILKEELL